MHLAAIAERRGLRLDLDEYDRLGRAGPVLIDLKPTGDITWSISIKPAACPG